MAPSEAVANVAASAPLAPTTNPPVEGTLITMPNAVVEQWDKMATDQGDLGEPMHVEGL